MEEVLEIETSQKTAITLWKTPTDHDYIKTPSAETRLDEPVVDLTADTPEHTDTLGIVLLDAADIIQEETILPETAVSTSAEDTEIYLLKINTELSGFILDGCMLSTPLKSHSPYADEMAMKDVSEKLSNTVQAGTVSNDCDIENRKSSMGVGSKAEQIIGTVIESTQENQEPDNGGPTSETVQQVSKPKRVYSTRKKKSDQTAVADIKPDVDTTTQPTRSLRPRRACAKKKDPDFVYNDADMTSQQTKPTPQQSKSSTQQAKSTKQQSKAPAKAAKRNTARTAAAKSEPPPKVAHTDDISKSTEAVVESDPMGQETPPLIEEGETVYQVISKQAVKRTKKKDDSDYVYEEDTEADYDEETEGEETDCSLPSISADKITTNKVTTKGKAARKTRSKTKIGGQSVLAKTSLEDTLVAEAEDSDTSLPFSDYSLPSIGAEEEVVCQHINRLTDGMILRIFRLLDTQFLCRTINRVCKKWNALSKDRVLCRDFDISFVAVGPGQLKRALKYCNGTTTRSLSVRAPSKRFTGDNRNRGGVIVSKCLTDSVLKDIKQSCASLSAFSLSYEQICNISVYPSLPRTLTSLSLPYCNISMHNFDSLFSPDPVLPYLRNLDLSGIVVIDSSYLGNDRALPRHLVKLSLRDAEISIYNDGMLRLIKEHKNLHELDLSLTHISLPVLTSLSKALPGLNTINLAGCLLAGDNARAMRPGAMDNKDWQAIWSTGFQGLQKINLRNIHQNSKKDVTKVKKFLCPARSLIQPDGIYTGSWTYKELTAHFKEEKKYGFHHRLQQEHHDREMQQQYGSRGAQYRSYNYGGNYSYGGGGGGGRGYSGYRRNNYNRHWY